MKVCLNLFDHLSAVATKTRAMVDAAHAENPRCEVLTTRKSMPGAKTCSQARLWQAGRFRTGWGCRRRCLCSTII